MRSAKEAGCFPYGSTVVCYIEAFPNGEVRQLSTKPENSPHTSMPCPRKQAVCSLAGTVAQRLVRH